MNTTVCVKLLDFRFLVLALSCSRDASINFDVKYDKTQFHAKM